VFLPPNPPFHRRGIIQHCSDPVKKRYADTAPYIPRNEPRKPGPGFQHPDRSLFAPHLPGPPSQSPLCGSHLFPAQAPCQSNPGGSKPLLFASIFCVGFVMGFRTQFSKPRDPPTNRHSRFPPCSMTADCSASQPFRLSEAGLSQRPLSTRLFPLLEAVAAHEALQIQYTTEAAMLTRRPPGHPHPVG